MQTASPSLKSYYDDLEQCLLESDETLGLVILEILKGQARVNRENPIKRRSPNTLS